MPYLSALEMSHNKALYKFTVTLKLRLHDTTCSQTTGWTTGCIVYTNIHLVVKPVVQPAVQLYSRLDNRLYRTNGVLLCCKHGLRRRTVGRVDNGKYDGDDEHKKYHDDAGRNACSLAASIHHIAPRSHS